MHKYILAVLLAVACVMGIVFTVEAVIEADKEFEASIVPDTELRIEAYNWYFDQDEYRVTVGETKDLTFYNKQSLHSALIVGLDEEIDLMEGDVVTYTFDKPGEYEIICNIACGEGHDTMRSKLIVEAAEATAE